MIQQKKQYKNYAREAIYLKKQYKCKKSMIYLGEAIYVEKQYKCKKSMIYLGKSIYK